MGYLSSGIKEAFNLIINFDSEVMRVVWTSIRLSTVSTILASLLGIPLGILISRIDFAGKNIFNIILNTLLSLPTVVVGISVYSLISHQGILGKYGLLFTFRGIIIGQVILILPIIVALVRNSIHDTDERMHETAISLGATGTQRFRLLLSEAKYGIMGAVVTAYGRAIGEIGVSMMLGGNIRRVTRTITTAIAMETNKGRFGFGLALGIILLLISFIVNFVIYYLQTGENNE